MLRFLLLLIPLCSGTLLSRPAGPNQLALNVSPLIDTSRKDGLNHIPQIDGITLRPSSPDTCYRKEKVPYMSPTISSTKAAIFAPYGLPAGIFAPLENTLLLPTGFWQTVRNMAGRPFLSRA